MSVFLDIADHDGFALDDSRTSDVLMYTSDPSQKILLGTRSNAGSTLKISRDDVTVSGAIRVTERDPQDPETTENLSSSFWSKSSTSNALYYAEGYVAIGRSDAQYPVDVSGAVRATSFVGDGSLLTGLQISPWSNTILEASDDQSYVLTMSRAGDTILSNLRFSSAGGLTFNPANQALTVGCNLSVPRVTVGGSVGGSVGSSATIESALSNGYRFASACNGDLVASTQSSSQRIHLGVLSNAQVTIASNAVFLGSDLLPRTSNAFSLGASNARFADVYLSRTLDVGGAALRGSNGLLTTSAGLTLSGATTMGDKLVLSAGKIFGDGGTVRDAGDAATACLGTNLPRLAALDATPWLAPAFYVEAFQWSNARSVQATYREFQLSSNVDISYYEQQTGLPVVAHLVVSFSNNISTSNLSESNFALVDALGRPQYDAHSAAAFLRVFPGSYSIRSNDVLRVEYIPRNSVPYDGLMSSWPTPYKDAQLPGSFYMAYLKLNNVMRTRGNSSNLLSLTADFNGNEGWADRDDFGILMANRGTLTKGDVFVRFWQMPHTMFALTKKGYLYARGRAADNSTYIVPSSRLTTLNAWTRITFFGPDVFQNNLSMQVACLVPPYKSLCWNIDNFFGAGVIDVHGRLWLWGDNAEGQLGVANTTAYPNSVALVNLGGRRVLQAMRTSRSVFAVTSDYRLYAWGHNPNYGSLGNGTDTTNGLSPKLVGLNVYQVYASQKNLRSTVPADSWECASMYLTRDGYLFGAGRGDQGSLGNGNAGYHPRRFVPATSQLATSATLLGTTGTGVPIVTIMASDMESSTYAPWKLLDGLTDDVNSFRSVSLAGYQNFSNVVNGRFTYGSWVKIVYASNIQPSFVRIFQDDASFIGEEPCGMQAFGRPEDDGYIFDTETTRRSYNHYGTSDRRFFKLSGAPVDRSVLPAGSNFQGVIPGLAIWGPGVPTGTTVLSVNSNTSNVTLSQATVNLSVLFDFEQGTSVGQTSNQGTSPPTPVSWTLSASPPTLSTSFFKFGSRSLCLSNNQNALFPNTLLPALGEDFTAEFYFRMQSPIGVGGANFHTYGNVVLSGTTYQWAHLVYHNNVGYLRYYDNTAGDINLIFMNSSNTTGTLTSNSALVTSIPTAALNVGQNVAGTGIQAGTTIRSMVDANSLLLSQPATLTGVQTLTMDNINRDIHVAIVQKKEIGNRAGISVYVNGQFRYNKGSTEHAPGGYARNWTGFGLNTVAANTPQNFSGGPIYIDDFRLGNYVKYTSDFAPPTVAGAAYDVSSNDAEYALQWPRLQTSNWLDLTNGFKGKQLLYAFDAAASDLYGHGIGLSSNQQVLAVGSINDDDVGADSGSVYVYRRDSNGHYNYEAKLLPTSVGSMGIYNIPISDDGNVIAAGARTDSTNRGAVYVYRRNPANGTWALDTNGKLVGSTSTTNDYAADWGPAMNGEGTRIAFGAYNVTRAVYIFRYVSNAWTQTQSITDPAGNIAGTEFGRNVAMSKDGQVLAIGARLATVNGLSQAGKVEVFRWNEASSTFVNTQRLVAADPGTNDQFGYGCLSMSADGSRIVLGAHPKDDWGTDNGAVYIFTYDAGTFSHLQTAKIIPADDNELLGYTRSAGTYNTAVFGHNGWMTSDGKAIAISAHGADVPTTDSGSVFLFRLDESSNAWRMTAHLTTERAANTQDYFGLGGVVLSDDLTTLAVGVPYDDQITTNAGAAHVYTLDPATLHPHCRMSRGNNGSAYGTGTLNYYDLPLNVPVPCKSFLFFFESNSASRVIFTQLEMEPRTYSYIVSGPLAIGTQSLTMVAGGTPGNPDGELWVCGTNVSTGYGASRNTTFSRLTRTMRFKENPSSFSLQAVSGQTILTIGASTGAVTETDINVTVDILKVWVCGASRYNNEELREFVIALVRISSASLSAYPNLPSTNFLAWIGPNTKPGSVYNTYTGGASTGTADDLRSASGKNFWAPFSQPWLTPEGVQECGAVEDLVNYTWRESDLAVIIARTSKGRLYAIGNSADSIVPGRNAASLRYGWRRIDDFDSFY